MTEQHTLFATGPTARPTDPETCAQAPTGDQLNALQARVLEVHRSLLAEQLGGLTDAELCALLPDVRPGTAIKRRTELLHAGHVVDTGRRRKAKPGCRVSSIVWAVAHAG